MTILLGVFALGHTFFTPRNYNRVGLAKSSLVLLPLVCSRILIKTFSHGLQIEIVFFTMSKQKCSSYTKYIKKEAGRRAEMNLKSIKAHFCFKISISNFGTLQENLFNRPNWLKRMPLTVQCDTRIPTACLSTVK